MINPSTPLRLLAGALLMLLLSAVLRAEPAAPASPDANPPAVQDASAETPPAAPAEAAAPAPETPEPAAKPDDTESSTPVPTTDTAPPPQPEAKPETQSEVKPEAQPEKAADKPAAVPQWKVHLQKKHEAFFQWLQENYPKKADDLKAVAEKNPEKFVQQIGEAMDVYEPIQKADKNDPELAKLLREDLTLQDQRDALLRKLCGAKEDQRAALTAELKTIVAARFDVIIRKKQMEYDQLRRRLDWLNKKLEQHSSELQKLKDEKDQSVENRTNELIEGKVNMNWK